jgi:RNA polymerase sigma-70 factor (ECF subfamily)
VEAIVQDHHEIRLGRPAGVQPHGVAGRPYDAEGTFVEESAQEGDEKTLHVLVAVRGRRVHDDPAIQVLPVGVFFDAVVEVLLRHARTDEQKGRFEIGRGRLVNQVHAVSPPVEITLQKALRVRRRTPSSTTRPVSMTDSGIVWPHVLMSDTRIGGPSRGFPSTHWSIVSSLRDRRDPEWERRVEALARLYWKPIYRQIRATWNLGNEEAKDLTQEFFVHMIEGRFFEEVSRAKGRFRSFVKACLSNFLKQRKRDASRQKRGGGRKLLRFSMDDEGAPDPADTGPSPEESIDREWRRTLMTEAIGRLRAALEAERRPKDWEAFRRYDLADTAERPKYRELAKELGMTEADVDNALARARKRLGEFVMAVVAESVADEDALRLEMSELFPNE